VDSPSRAEIARSQREREQLAKEWLLRIIERTPLEDVGALPVSWIVEQAPPLIADIVDALHDPAGAPHRELSAAERERAAQLVRLRDGASAPQQIPRDLAALQALLVETLRREIPERRPGDFAHAVERLAEVFGSIQGTVAGALVEERSGGARLDELTGLPGRAQLDEWVRILLTEYGRYSHPFALALVDLDGLGRINDAFGRDAGDRILVAVAGVIRRQIRAADQAFRLADGEFCVLAPHQQTDGLLPMAERFAALISQSQADDGPRIAITAGVASCPADGDTAEELFAAAERAVFAAKAAGVQVMSGANGSGSYVQDR
jgi:diguanylate cyclase (GGDEF)-like protein